METLIHLVVVALLLVALPWGLFRLLVPKKGPPMVCTQCGQHGPAKSHTRGTMALELALWLMFILPGIIYSLWRLSTRANVCASCGSAALVAPESPAGRRMLREDQNARDVVRSAVRVTSAKV
ncbi:MAG: hypothetical protein KAY54_03630 [Burkholderiaceae bacterium]|nr:hypothetical protein [Burkholderiaceae bacterium]